MLWTESSRFVFTLLMAVMGALAVAMIPGAKRVLQNRTAWYLGTGRYIVAFLGVQMLTAAAFLGYEWYAEGAGIIWVTGNTLLFIALGTGILWENEATVRRLKAGAGPDGGDQVVEAEVVEEAS